MWIQHSCQPDLTVLNIVFCFTLICCGKWVYPGVSGIFTWDTEEPSAGSRAARDEGRSLMTSSPITQPTSVCMCWFPFMLNRCQQWGIIWTALPLYWCKKPPFVSLKGPIQLPCTFVCVCMRVCVFNTWLRGRFQCLPFCESAAGWRSSSSKVPPPDQAQTHALWVTHTWCHCSAVAASALLMFYGIIFVFALL